MHHVPLANSNAQKTDKQTKLFDFGNSKSRRREASEPPRFANHATQKMF